MIPLPNKVRWRAMLGVGAIALIVVQQGQIRLQGIALEKAEFAYKNPEKRKSVKLKKTEGPVLTKTHKVKRPDGTEETTVEELRGAVVTERERESVETPIFAPAARASGWVAGIGLDGWTPYAMKDVAAYGGYRFFGRLDVMGRYQVGGKAGVVALWRF